jgi:hypothetical protein
LISSSKVAADILAARQLDKAIKKLFAAVLDKQRKSIHKKVLAKIEIL